MTPIFDNGHGGIVGGVYKTNGKRSPDWNKGVLYEGAFNRWAVNRLIEKCDREGVEYYHASPESLDVGLRERKDRANAIHYFDTDTYLISIHANLGGGQGIEGFTSPGETKSDEIAEMFLKNLENDLPDQKMRFDLGDKDRDKEQRFYLLTKTICPAFLLECGFMDHPKDYEKLWDEGYLTKIVNSLFKTIQELQKI